MMRNAVFKAAGALASAVFLIGAAAPGSKAQDVLDPETMLPGYWGWVQEELPERLRGVVGFGDCEEDPLEIWFTEDGARYNGLRRSGEEVYSAPILQRLPASPSRAGFHIRYDSHEQLGPEGRRLEWILVMTSRNRFHWIDTNWPAGARTASLERCDIPEIG